MKAITVRGIDHSLAEKLKEIAKQEGKSVNQTIIDTLKRHCGLEKEKKFTRIYHDMDTIFGRWSQREFDAIQGNIEAERKIDPELWR